jgi:hypothetical protein
MPPKADINFCRVFMMVSFVAEDGRIGSVNHCVIGRRRQN